MEEQRYKLQIKERRIVKDCYKSNELPFVCDMWVDHMIGYNKQEMQDMIDRSLCKDDYRIVTY
jgi:hypothetical protein